MGDSKKTKILAIIAITIVILVAVYVLFLPKIFNIQNLSQTSKTKTFTNEIRIPLKKQTAYNEAGNATLNRNGDKVIVLVVAKGQSGEKNQPVNIYSGSCGKLGDKQYSLKNVVNEKSTTEINVDGDTLIKQLPLYISVSKSATDNTSVACGEIKL